MNKMKINTLEIQNVKRIKAVEITMNANGLTVIGGRNKQGKTSVLDSIAYVLGGQRYCPSNLKREGSMADPSIKITMDNGLIAERTGKNAALKVTDPTGGRSGQQLLNDFVSELAINLPKFNNSSTSEKAKFLLSILGIGDELGALEKAEKAAYDERHTVGVIADRKLKFADEMPCFDGVPEVPVAASELIREQQDIFAKNGENQRKRQNVDSLINKAESIAEKINAMKLQMDQLEAEESEICNDLATAKMSATDLQDESTAEVEAKLEEIDLINTKVRANLDKSKAQDDATTLRGEYDTLSQRVADIRAKRLALLNGADMPLPDLSIEDGELVYKGQKWDCMSGAEQLCVGTAIAQKLNPNCGFVLIDKAEQFDADTLSEYGLFLEGRDLQAIATRVSTGDECSIIIEDGELVEEKEAPAKIVPKF